MKRDSCDKVVAENILKNQLTLEEFTKQSDYVIYNDSDISFLREQVDKFMIKLSINDD
jgi:dephospho-CoA kinase